MSYLTVPLNPGHNISDFDCGKEPLNSYLKNQVNQDVKEHLAVCFVIVTDKNKVKGYFTLSGLSINKELIPKNLRRRLHYRDIPVTLLGRLSRDIKYKTERLGETLLLDALRRSYDSSFKIGSMAVVVDPIDEEAGNFYSKYGFINLPDSKRMFITMETISKLF